MLQSAETAVTLGLRHVAHLGLRHIHTEVQYSLVNICTKTDGETARVMSQSHNLSLLSKVLTYQPGLVRKMCPRQCTPQLLVLRCNDPFERKNRTALHPALGRIRYLPIQQKHALPDGELTEIYSSNLYFYLSLYF